jgi:hypothetical protein
MPLFRQFLYGKQEVSFRVIVMVDMSYFSYRHAVRGAIQDANVVACANLPFPHYA